MIEKKVNLANVRFPNHKQARMRDTCRELLMKTVCSVDGKPNLVYPKKRDFTVISPLRALFKT